MNFAQSSAVYFNYTLQYAIKDLYNLGYQGIEIWGGRPHMYRCDLDREMDKIVSLIKRLSMKVCNLIPAQFRYPSLLCSPNEVVRKESVEYIKSAIDNAIKVGSPSVSLCPGMVPFNESIEKGWNHLFESLKEIEEYNKDKGLILLIEPAHRFESNLILTVDDGLKMLNELKSNMFGILIDTGHTNINNEDFSEIIAKCKDISLHIHLDDNNGKADSHMIPGNGTVDFKKLFTELDKIDYQGFISTELGSSYTMDPTSACRETMKILKKMTLSNYYDL